ncbi:MAG: galactose mutarotase [Ruminococcus sp.]|nr:galactose mutarotase [Ruminococcus sp.]
MIQIISQPFGSTKNGQAVARYTMTNSSGMSVSVISYGCAVQSIIVPDRNGKPRDVVPGYDSVAGYENGTCYFGAFVGRCANRIGEARFSLNGNTIELEKNDGENHLHGILAKRVYDGTIDHDSVMFRVVSPPEEEGYPGTLSVKLRYRLTEENALEISYEASSDEDTVVNLTNHSYFNLNGQDGSDILSHYARIDADRFTEINKNMIPTGRILPVEDTPLDFRQEKAIGTDIFSENQQIEFTSGYDHNLILKPDDGTLKEFARVKSEKTGIVLSASTTEPAVQFYTGNCIHEDPVPHGKNGVRYPRFGGFCLEAQHYPDAVNHPHFPSTVLKKGEIYRQKTIYRFAVIQDMPY